MPHSCALIAALALLTAGPACADNPRVLVFSRTAGFRHDSIPAGIAAVQRLGAESNFGVTATEDPTAFTDEGLRPYAAVVFLNTTGDVLNDEQQGAFERYIAAGRGYVGIHSAADTEYDWPWYGGLVGAYFKGHPDIQEATVVVADRVHPATSHLPPRWPRRDEWYTYRESPRGNVHVLATVDERTYRGGGMGYDHPIAWCQHYAGGRAFYTGGGHTIESFSEPLFVEHLRGGILWAAGLAPGDAGATVWSNWDKTVLDANVTDPMELAVTPDGRVVFIERAGTIRVYKPSERRTVLAHALAVFNGVEDGLLGLTLDPGFAENNWLYVYYSPAGSREVNVLSRFTMSGDSIDPRSERIMLEVPTQRGECCHSGGSLAFGPDGTLYLSTGDNTNPFASDGYAPIDEREGREPWDAQRTSANTHDLRGKILRIQPLPDGTYAIPPGNLFPRDGEGGGIGGRPEIYVMGCRNPFRIGIDPKTGWLYWGDVGPDGHQPKEGRGPAGHDEYNQARAAGFFGWPLFIADNKPYNDFDFATGASGPLFDAGAPVNSSPNNTGSASLPPPQPAWIYYPYGESREFPEMKTGGRCAMAGPTHHVDDAVKNERKLPRYYDNTLFLYEWERNRILEVKLDEAGNPLKINPFMPGTPFVRPMDLELGPDGCLYVIEWGTGFGGGNKDSRISRLEYYPGGQRPPLAVASATPTSGPLPLTVRFSSEGTVCRNAGSSITYEWDFDGDAKVDSTEANPTHTFTRPGDYFVRLVVTDRLGPQGAAGVPVAAGNSAPRVAFEWPPDGGIVGFGEEVEYRLSITDAEDAVIDERRVRVQPSLGHDTHAHPLLYVTGSTGRVKTMRDESHGADANLFTVLAATYQDGGVPGVFPLTGKAELILQPRRKQAEHYTRQEGAVLERVGDPQGGLESMAFLEDGDWASYRPVNLHGIDSLRFRVASATQGGAIEVRLGAVDGPLVATAAVPGTGGWQEWTDAVAPVDTAAAAGTHELFLVFRGPEGYLFNLNWIEFIGPGCAAGSAE